MSSSADPAHPGSTADAWNQSTVPGAALAGIDAGKQDRSPPEVEARDVDSDADLVTFGQTDLR
ncbi:MAG: hypothetical protein AAGA20_06620 [Planctomycetota bacterium]